MRDQTRWDQKAPLLAAYHFGQSRALLFEVELLVGEAFNDPVLKREMISRLVNLLDSDATPDCLRFVCRQLALLGGKESVPSLERRLRDKEVGEAAIHALQIIPHSSAATALRSGLLDSENPMRVAVANALGERRDPLAVGPLSRVLSEPDENLAEASARALGKIGSRFGVGALLAACEKRPPSSRSVFSHAALECAERLAEQGRTGEAAEIYSRLAKAETIEPVRAAAECGLKRTTPRR